MYILHELLLFAFISISLDPMACVVGAVESDIAFSHRAFLRRPNGPVLGFLTSRNIQAILVAENIFSLFCALKTSPRVKQAGRHHTHCVLSRICRLERVSSSPLIACSCCVLSRCPFILRWAVWSGLLTMRLEFVCKRGVCSGGQRSQPLNEGGVRVRQILRGVCEISPTLKRRDFPIPGLAHAYVDM